jgi:hypothetical protein
MRLLFVFLLIFGHVVAQTEIKPKHSFKIDLCLPNALINKPFKSIMQGLVQADPYYQYTTQFGLSFGAGVDFRYFTINEFRLPGKVKGGMSFVGGFAKIGFEKFITPKFAIDCGVRLGYDYVISKNAYELSVLGKPHTFTTPYIEPTLSLYLTTDENSAFCLTLGYTFMGMKFSADELQLSEITGYSANQFTKISQIFSVGFGYSYYFKSKNK